jgi:hypothetical protein
MERTRVLDLMATLKLYGMRSAYDEVMATGVKRQHEPPRIVGDLLSAEIAEKQARSIIYVLPNRRTAFGRSQATCPHGWRRGFCPAVGQNVLRHG